jgi:predicted transcriptional regulator
MDQETAPAAKRRPNAHLRELRRARIFTRLREGWPYTEIAREEGLTDRRIRQIVSDTLKKRVVDAPADHALLQLARLEPALRLAAGAVASGDVQAIRYYLKLLDQLDRYRPAAAPPAYDDAARERLYAKMGEVAARLQAKSAKEARRTEAGDPMREGEAGVEKIPAASAATP